MTDRPKAIWEMSAKPKLLCMLAQKTRGIGIYAEGKKMSRIGNALSWLKRRWVIAVVAAVAVAIWRVFRRAPGGVREGPLVREARTNGEKAKAIIREKAQDVCVEIDKMVADDIAAIKKKFGG